MYSKLLIWSTINTKSATREKRQVFLVRLPSTRLTVKTATLHRTWCSGAVSRGRGEGCSSALSLGNTAGISVGIYCCLPKPYLRLTCHNVASAFFGLLESVRPIPLGNGCTGLCEGRSYHACQWERNTGLSPAGPALANPHRRQGESWLEGDVAPFTVPHSPNASSACSGKVFSWSERQWDFWLSKDWKNRVPRLLFSKQTKTYNLLFTGRKPQFVFLMKLLHSAELNASAAKMALSANWHDRLMPPTTLPKHKEHFKGTMSHSIP